MTALNEQWRGNICFAAMGWRNRGRTRKASARHSTDRYELLDVIGNGASGVVHLAWDRNAKRYVAAKVVAAHSDDLALHRFFNEQRVAVEHPNLLTPLDWFQTPDAAVLVMDLADAGSVADLLGDGTSVSPHLVERIATQALAGLGALHRSGILHRDLKPANLMLTRRGDGVDVLVGDFGIAVSEHTPRLTQQRGVVGTLGFVAPEVLSGEDDTVRSDLWSLGTTIAALVDRADPPVSRRLDALVASLTRTDPDARPATAEEAATQLDASADDTPITMASASTRAADAIRRDRSRRTRRRVVRAGAVGVVTCLVAALAAVAWPRTAPDPAWLVARRAAAAAGRVECLRFPNSEGRLVRTNYVPPPISTTTFTRRLGDHRAVDVKVMENELSATELIYAGMPPSEPAKERTRIGVWQMTKSTSPGWYFFGITGLEYAMSLASSSFDRVDDVDREARRFLESASESEDGPVPGAEYREQSPVLQERPMWSVTAGRQTVSAFKARAVALENLPGDHGTVLRRPAVIGPAQISWSEADDVVVVMTTGEFDAATSGRAAYVVSQIRAAEQLRPCTTRTYRALRPQLGDDVALVVEPDPAVLGRYLTVAVNGDVRTVLRMGTEGTSVQHAIAPGSVQLWWGTSEQAPGCAPEFEMPAKGAKPVVVSVDPSCTAVDRSAPNISALILACSGGAVAFRASPGLSASAQPTRIVLEPRFSVGCRGTDEDFIDGNSADPALRTATSFSIGSDGIEFPSLGCPPRPGAAGTGAGSLTWSDGTTSAAEVTVRFDGQVEVAIRVTGGHLAGTTAGFAADLYPFDGDCDHGGITRGLIVVPSLTFTRTV